MTIDQMVEAVRDAIDRDGRAYTTNWAEPSTQHVAQDRKFLVVDETTGTRYLVKVSDEPNIKNRYPYYVNW